MNLGISKPGNDARFRAFTRPTITTIILIVLVVMIMMDIFIYRRRSAAHSLPT
jgi:hypothetical protein